MAFFPNRQSPTPLVSGRATVAHLNRAQQPRPTPISGRALVGQLGIGRRYTGLHDLLSPRQLLLPEPPAPDFYRLRADAQRLQQQLAAPDTLARLSEPAPPLVPALPPPRTPAQAGYPIPFLSPAQQQHRAHAQAQRQQQALAAYNRAAQAPYLSPFLRQILSQPRISMLRVEPAGPDCFMPPSFWKSQAPNWINCCNTVKKMFTSSSYEEPITRKYIVKEYGRTLVVGRDEVEGIKKLDEYMAMRKPVMAGVTHTFGMTLTSKLHPDVRIKLNEGTTDHFIAIVGVGNDKGRKYYRFFDVGTADLERGTSTKNRLYLDNSTGFYVGHSQATNKDYTLSQLRF